MKNIRLRTWLCLAGMIAFATAACAVEPKDVVVTKRLVEGETFGREIRIPYGSFDEQSLPRKILRQAKEIAAKEGIMKFMIVKPVAKSPRRDPLQNKISSIRPKDFSPQAGADYVQGEFVAREVLRPPAAAKK